MGLKIITALFICMALYEAAEGGSWSRCKPFTTEVQQRYLKFMKVLKYVKCVQEKKTKTGWNYSYRIRTCNTCKGSRGSGGNMPNRGNGGNGGGNRPSGGSAKGTRANSIADVASECVKAHNHYRKKYGNRKDLVNNAGIARGAADWAFTLADEDKWDHSGTKYGENLYMSAGSVVSDKAAVWSAVKKWYDEVKDWRGCQRVTPKKTGHFTAVVWKSTTDVGCGVARRGSATYVVGRYNPAGNNRRFCSNV